MKKIKESKFKNETIKELLDTEIQLKKDLSDLEIQIQEAKLQVSRCMEDCDSCLYLVGDIDFYIGKKQYDECFTSLVLSFKILENLVERFEFLDKELIAVHANRIRLERLEILEDVLKH